MHQAAYNPISFWVLVACFLLQVFSCIADYTFSSHPYAFLAHTVIPKTALLLSLFGWFFFSFHHHTQIICVLNTTDS